MPATDIVHNGSYLGCFVRFSRSVDGERVLTFAVAVAMAAPSNAEAFATVGRSAHGSFVSDGASTSDGLATGLGLAFASRPNPGRFTILTRFDVQYVLTGDNHLANAHAAVMFGCSWEHFRAVIGPSIHAPIALGLSLDLAALLDPIVIAVFADAGILAVVEARAGVRAVIVF